MCNHFTEVLAAAQQKRIQREKSFLLARDHRLEGLQKLSEEADIALDGRRRRKVKKDTSAKYDL